MKKVGVANCTIAGVQQNLFMTVQIFMVLQFTYIQEKFLTFGTLYLEEVDQLEQYMFQKILQQKRHLQAFHWV